MKKLGILSSVLLAASMAGALAPQAAVADPAVPIVVPVHGYVWANQPAVAGYFANTGYEHNSLGGSIHISRYAVGRYFVRFYGMARDGGVAHVNAYGSNHRCIIQSYFPYEGDQYLHIRCFDIGGNPVDTKFIANFTTRKPAGVSFGYLWNDNPAPAWFGHVPPAAYSHDGAGEQIRVYRDAVGRYLVYLGAFAQDVASQWRNGFLVATAYGMPLAGCQANGSDPEYPSYIRVRCSDLDGQPADTKFTLTYSRDKSLMGTPQRASVMANVIGAPIVEGWSNSAGGAPVVTTLGTGSFQADFPNIGGPGGHAYASLMNTSPMYCTVKSWNRIGTTLRVQVRCYDPGVGEPHPAGRINVTFVP